MQIFFLDRNPVKAARALRHPSYPGKMLVEATQLLSTALRAHGRVDERLCSSFNPSHPCAVWAADSKANFLWLLAHARELGNIHTAYLRARCKRCMFFKTASKHASILVVDHIFERLKMEGVDAFLSGFTDQSDPDAFFDALHSIRARQKSAKSRELAVLRAHVDIPEGVTCMSLAIAKEYRSHCIVRDAEERIHGIETMRKYHEFKTSVNPIFAPWQSPSSDGDGRGVCNCKTLRHTHTQQIPQHGKHVD